MDLSASTSDTIIRTLTQTDTNDLWEILYYAIHVPTGTTPPPSEIVKQPELARYVQAWDETRDLGYGVLIENRLQGAAWLRLFTAAERGYGYWNDETPELSIALAPHLRGQGLGTRLMEKLLDHAATRYRAVSLSVAPDNPARRLYERFGFHVVDRDAHALLMVKQFRI